MKRAQQITFGVNYGLSAFPYPEALIQIAGIADEGVDDFWIMNRDGKPRVVMGAPDGDEIFARGVVRDDWSADPLDDSVEEVNRNARPVMEYHRADGDCRVVYPANYRGAEPYTGRIYRQFKSDCYSLMRDYYSDVLGIKLPTGTIEEAEALANRLGRSYLETAFEEYGFTPVAKPRQHDVALIVAPGDIAHIAILIEDCERILHHPARRLSCIAPYAGAWKRHTVALFRRTR